MVDEPQDDGRIDSNGLARQFHVLRIPYSSVALHIETDFYSRNAARETLPVARCSLLHRGHGTR